MYTNYRVQFIVRSSPASASSSIGRVIIHSVAFTAPTTNTVTGSAILTNDAAIPSTYFISGPDAGSFSITGTTLSTVGTPTYVSTGLGGFVFTITAFPVGGGQSKATAFRMRFLRNTGNTDFVKFNNSLVPLEFDVT